MLRVRTRAGNPEQVVLPLTTIKLLRRTSTATITTQLFKRGLHNTFLQGVRPLNPKCEAFVGEAFTLRCIPSREDIDLLSVFDDYDHPQRKAIESVGPRQVLVVDARQDLRSATAGNILLTRLMRRGAAGFVTDGAVRDSAEIRKLALPVFVGGVSATVSLAYHHAVDIQVPIACAGVPVYPGDLLVGDQEGVVCIPRSMATEIASLAVEQEELEKFLLTKVRHGARLRGTYPPNESTRREYLERRGKIQRRA